MVREYIVDRIVTSLINRCVFVTHSWFRNESHNYISKTPMLDGSYKFAFTLADGYEIVDIDEWRTALMRILDDVGYNVYVSRQGFSEEFFIEDKDSKGRMYPCRLASQEDIDRINMVLTKEDCCLIDRLRLEETDINI